MDEVVLLFLLLAQQSEFLSMISLLLIRHVTAMMVLVHQHNQMVQRILSATPDDTEMTPGWTLGEWAALHDLQVIGRARRRIWMWTRPDAWWENLVATGSPCQWKESFRISRATFVRLVALVRPHMSPAPNWVRTPVPTDKQVAIALYKLASCGESRCAASLFGVHKSTVHNCVYLFCYTLRKQFLSQFIRMPDHDEATVIAQRFLLKCGIPQVIGAVDGTHIPVLPPSVGYRDYVNRKGWPSLVLQAVVDDRMRFRNIYCALPGSAHDASVLKSSRLYTDNSQLIPQVHRDVRGTLVPYVILGDPAYPLLPWLIKPFPQSRRLTAEQELFNERLSAGRVIVEHAFGRLKSRWRCVMKRTDINYKFVPTLVVAVSVLHNICEDSNEGINPSWVADMQDLERTFPQPTRQSQADGGNAAVQDALCAYTAAHLL
ncbi:uncharacterized protein LOC135372507 [Ornithodoros turicata]|uniref:uncharacterized protein LOC135372507 n=1 Tax=Ornithodoros turicata TaxID=34597 RepID=UPI00313937C4